ncbi:hypothetical protein C461_03207 [Halorubrum aidingense JCM 13560]|uniref:Uncharacterized protein n=1 Tax=Halorubrum aidingense JCM 13560 TaxID=1230454 RepID=M0PK78_9EURY|nr:hypothetical protein [Halorubrum aidingense]EMA69150.1 hypothetical protein C461_03207 [Halorubrum aidingense JCM 13560]
MRNTIPRTSKRMNRIESNAADQFDATLLHNRVYEAIGEDSQLRQLVDVTERAYQLEEDQQFVHRVRRAAFGAAEDLNDEIDDVVNARVAAECAALITDARDGWFDDHADRADIDAAFVEAKAWLNEHGDAACDAGIDVEAVLYGDDGDADQEVTADV